MVDATSEILPNLNIIDLFIWLLYFKSTGYEFMWILVFAPLWIFLFLQSMLYETEFQPNFPYFQYDFKIKNFFQFNPKVNFINFTNISLISRDLNLQCLYWAHGQSTVGPLFPYYYTWKWIIKLNSNISPSFRHFLC